MSAPNLLSPTTVTGKSAGLAVTGSAVAIVAAPATGHSINVRALYISNITAAAHTITVDVFKAATTAYRIAKDMIVPANATITVITSEAPVTLEETDTLRLTADTTSAIEGLAVYDDIS